MAVEVPCQPGVPNYDMSIVLDGATYVLEFLWNTRESSWYMHVKAQDETPIQCGIKVVPSWPLGARVADVRMPPGRFVAVDTSGKQQPPGLADLGDRVRLVYLELADFA